MMDSVRKNNFKLKLSAGIILLATCSLVASARTETVEIDPSPVIQQNECGRHYGGNHCTTGDSCPWSC